MCCYFHSSFISPSRTREILIEVKDPSTIGKNQSGGHSHFFCVVSVRDLLTTSRQTHIIPLLSFCRPSQIPTSETSKGSVNQHHVTCRGQLSENKVAAEKPYHYHYSTHLCHPNASDDNLQSVNHVENQNQIEASIIVKVN